MSDTDEIPLVRPFAGLRPAPEHAAGVAAPPYDVVTTEEARALVSLRPWSFLHVSKAEIDLPPGTDHYAPEVYAKAAANLKHMVAQGVLRRDPAPRYYIYRVGMGDHTQTGIVGAGSVAAYEENRIRRHEFTQPDKETDRFRQIEAMNAQTGPVFVTHPPDSGIAAVIRRVSQTPPAYDVTGHGDTRHALWVVSQAVEIDRISRAFSAMRAIYIADGHHRSAAAARVAAKRRDAGAPDGGAHESFLIVSFPADEVQILDYNRVVRSLNGLSEIAFMEKLGRTFTVTPEVAPVHPAHARTFGMYLGRKWYRLRLRDSFPDDATPVQRLDVSVLSDKLIEPVLGISDPRRDPGIDFVGGIRGLAELERRVDRGGWAVAFSLFPTRVEDLKAVADAGQIMPPKSTWFEPKLADGLISLVLD